jgi:glycosyltransferase involved in cell wall biosynthesis
MAMGLCPVVTRFGYNLDLIEHGETGFLADTEDEWVGILVDLLRNPDKAMRIGRNALRFIETAYAHEKIVPTWADALHDLDL